MAKLYFTIGLPACGKSTVARERILKDGNLVRVNKDELRPMLHGDREWKPKQEKYTNKAQRAMVVAMLNAGMSVIVDDTNLNEGRQKSWKDLAIEHGHKWEAIDLRNVPIETCLQRDLIREKRVGHDVIHRMAWQAGLMKQENMWVGVDLDGTLADITARRKYAEKPDGSLDYKKFFDPEAVYEMDEPRHDVIDMVKAEKKKGHDIIILSGRSDVTKWSTFDWLDKHRVPYDRIIMRPHHDRRRDDVLKLEFLDTLTDASKLVKIIDDRPQVIRAWRSRGIEVVDVGDGQEF